MRKILPFILLTSCSYKPTHPQNIIFQEPGPISRSMVRACIHPETSSVLQHLRGKHRLKDVGRDFLKDIGGVSVQIPTEYGALEGMYFSPELFHEKETAAYKKWKKLFAAPKNVRLSQIYEINFTAHTLPGLFSLPRMIKPSKKAKERTMGVLCLPAADLDYELDPQFILTFLLRGAHVLAISYSDIEWKKTCFEAKSAVEWFSKHIQVPYDDLTICGKSFGSGPATYAASECQGLNLIIDRGYARFSDAHPSPIRWLIEKYYRFPNEDWISRVQGKVLIIEAREDLFLQGHAQRLYNAVTHTTKTLISAYGCHYGLYWGDPFPSWYTDEKSQSQLNPFFD